MRTITLFNIYKTKLCDDIACKLKNENNLRAAPFEEYCECQNYHSKFDQRRPPFQDFITFEYAYEAGKPKANPEKGSLNKVEYFFHPECFKNDECENKSSCKLTFCTKYHSEEEASEWIDIKRTLKVLRDLRGNTENEEYKNIMELAFWASAQPKKKALTTSQGIIEVNLKDKQSKSPEKISNNLFNDLIGFEEVKVDQMPKFGNPIFQDLFKKPTLVEESQISPPIQNNTLQLTELFPSQVCNDNFIPRQTFSNVMLVPNELDNSNDITLDIPEHNNLDQNQILEARKYADLKKNPFKDVYLYRTTVDMKEDDMHEFKVYQNPKNFELQDIINKYVCGFLNHKGGTIYLGIDDDGLCIGTHCDRRSLDEVRLEVDNTLKKFEPPIMPSEYRVIERKIWDENRKCIMKDRGIIEIIVNVGNPEELYFASNQKAYVRRQASCPILNPQEIKQEIKNRMKTHYIKKSLDEIKNPQFKNEIEKMPTDYLKSIKPKIKDAYQDIKKVLKNRGEES